METIRSTNDSVYSKYKALIRAQEDSAEKMSGLTDLPGIKNMDLPVNEICGLLNTLDGKPAKQVEILHNLHKATLIIEPLFPVRSFDSALARRACYNIIGKRDLRRFFFITPEETTIVNVAEENMTAFTNGFISLRKMQKVEPESIAPPSKS